MPGPLFRNVGHDLDDYPEIALALAIIVRDAHAQGVPLGSMRRILERVYVYARFGQIDTVIAAVNALPALSAVPWAHDGLARH